MSTAKIGTFDDLLEMTPEALRPVATALRQVILDLHPDACEVVRLGDRAATFGLGPKKMSEGYVYVLPYSRWVNLGFFRGTDLDDPEGLLQGTGARLRHVKVATLDQADTPAVRALIRAARQERTAALS